LDSWYDRGAKIDTVEIDILGGQNNIVLEYYQHVANASVSLDYFPVGFLGEFYKGKNLGKGADNEQVDPPYMYRYDPSINFDWSSGSPDPRFSRDNYSVRWSGLIELPVGRYDILSKSDDGVRVLIDGRLIIHSWHNQSSPVLRNQIDLVGRYHEVVLEYYENSDAAECRLEFNRLL
jgi:hypothetical protein